MDNEKSIHRLIEEQENEKISFLVPSYQRGYRWQRVNVSDLLNDLYEFIHSDKTDYSLQPLVVFCSDKTYHVVDGQQRLTTISILLGYLGLKQLDICYESRKGKQVNYYSEENENIDQYHVNQAYKTIENWFEKHPGERENFKQLLFDEKIDNKTKRVKFIWYSTTDDEVATFIRLNKNKISLTNAELIKAMLLKKGNFTGDSILKQKSIAVEWNNIENTFNDDAFWCFIRPINDTRSTRIDYLFDIIVEKNLLNYQPHEDVGNDDYSTFRYFYSYFKENKDIAFDAIWEQVNRLFNILLHWYNEIEVYHYVGFLVVNNNSDIISSLLVEWLKPDMTIDSFKKHLKSEINKIIAGSGCNNLSKQYKDNEEGGTDKTKCRPLLLLFNIQRILILNRNMNKKSESQLFNKFPFYLYQAETWNVEHIASNTDKDFSEFDVQKEWLKTFLLDNSISEDYRNDIKDFITKNPNAKSFSDLKKALLKVNSIKAEERLDHKQKNQIWNFCLLDEHTNKSYQNSIFPVKRRIIMGKEMGKKYVISDEDLKEYTVSNEVAFVPVCTKDVFIKAYTANATSHREWTRMDAEAYRQEMYDCLKSEFNVSI